MTKLQIQFFGVFHNYLDQKAIEIEVPEDCKVKDLRSILVEHCLPVLKPHHQEKFKQAIQLSAFADSSQILHDHTQIPSGSTIAVLPPVCGG